MGSSLATLQAAKAVDFYGCLPGHCIEVADAEQAYIQADIQGDPTLIGLPPEARPDWWKKSFPHLTRQVFLLKKTLYGPPEAGNHLGKKRGVRRAHPSFVNSLKCRVYEAASAPESSSSLSLTTGAMPWRTSPARRSMSFKNGFLELDLSHTHRRFDYNAQEWLGLLTGTDQP